MVWCSQETQIRNKTFPCFPSLCWGNKVALSVIPGVLICAVLAAKQLKMIVFFPFHHLQSALKIQKKAPGICLPCGNSAKRCLATFWLFLSWLPLFLGGLGNPKCHFPTQKKINQYRKEINTQAIPDFSSKY